MTAGTEESVDPIYSLLKSAAGLPTARSPVSSPAPLAALTDVQPSTSDIGTRSRNDCVGGSVQPQHQHHPLRSNSGSPQHHKSQWPSPRLQLQLSLQQDQRKLPPVVHLHLPGMINVQPPCLSGVFFVLTVDSRRPDSCRKDDRNCDKFRFVFFVVDYFIWSFQSVTDTHTHTHTHTTHMFRVLY